MTRPFLIALLIAAGCAPAKDDPLDPVAGTWWAMTSAISTDSSLLCMILDDDLGIWFLDDAEEETRWGSWQVDQGVEEEGYVLYFDLGSTMYWQAAEQVDSWLVTYETWGVDQGEQYRIGGGEFLLDPCGAADEGR